MELETGNIRDLLNTITTRLDYSLEFAEDRIDYLNQLMDQETNERLIEYISSPLFCDKQRKSKADYLSENDLSMLKMNQIVDYLVFPKYKNRQEKEDQQERAYMIREKKSEMYMDYRRANEMLFGDHQVIEGGTRSRDIPQKIYKVDLKHQITPADLEQHPEINEVYQVLAYLKRKIYSASASPENQLEDKQVKQLKALYRELSAEILELKERLSGPIRFKKVQQSAAVYNFDPFAFAQEQHIRALIQGYYPLNQKFHDRPDSDIWTLLLVLDELIEKTCFEDYMRLILKMKIDGYEAGKIILEIKNKYNIESTEKKISEIYNHTIPKMIVSTYLQDREDWVYTYEVKGTYKTCSKCGEVKLAISKYFHSNSSSKDGLHSVCKACKKKTKK